jgi:hypothetical protein
MSEEKTLIIDGVPHIHTLEVAKRLGITPQRVRELIGLERVSAVYLNGYYVPEPEVKGLKNRKPGRPATKAAAKKAAKK